MAAQQGRFVELLSTLPRRFYYIIVTPHMSDIPHLCSSFIVVSYDDFDVRF